MLEKLNAMQEMGKEWEGLDDLTDRDVEWIFRKICTIVPTAICVSSDDEYTRRQYKFIDGTDNADFHVDITIARDYGSEYWTVEDWYVSEWIE